jgi:hypothetical protein
MVEQAFRVAKGSSLYTDYFNSHAEKQKFHDLARAFFDKHNLLQNKGYYQTEFLALQLTEEQREQYSSQLKKLIDKNNMSYFKKNSPMYKEWKEDVVSKVDMNVLGCTDFWYWPIISMGSYALWHTGDALYGFLKDVDKDSLHLPDYMEPIKLSEYYAVKESLPTSRYQT